MLLTSQSPTNCTRLSPAKFLVLAVPCVPEPDAPIVTRSLGAVAPPLPSAEAGMIAGMPIAADADAKVFRKSLLFICK